MQSRCRIGAAIMMMVMIASTTTGQILSTRSDKPLTEVGEVIEQLGSTNYATRVRARGQLQRMGLQAFDELHAAQFHADSEIAMAARHLVSSLLVSWSTESDPPAVREALDEYGAQSESERQNRMDRLAELPEHQGLAALCRLARFETSLRLSREAALAIMRLSMAPDEAQRQRDATTIREVMGPNDRRAADWLRAYADDIADGKYSAQRWSELIRQQRQSMDDGSDPTSNRPAVLELVQVCASRAAKAGLTDDALAISIEHLDLIPPRSREVIDACSWAIDNQMHSIVLELKKRHAELFDRQPTLLYDAAEAVLADGDIDQAERLARQALNVDPLPGVGSDEEKKLSPKVVEEIAQRHRELARELETHGLFRWAEREYRHIIELSAEDSTIAATAKNDLSKMLMTLDRHDDCIEILAPVVARADADQQYARRLSGVKIYTSRMKEELAYQRGLSDLKKNDQEAARKNLSNALAINSANIDIIIAMYRTDGDQAWKDKVQRLIDETTRALESEITSRKTQAKPLMRQLDNGITLAEALNQYAWLISNTTGDYQKALRYSLESLNFYPDSPEQLDTAGRCYFAVGDVENAIRMQRRAAKMKPHSPPITRQLAEFENALNDASDPASDAGS